MHDITLRKSWIVKASIEDVARIMTDFEKFPVYFPKVAESVKIVKKEGDTIEIEASVRSFGRSFPVTMKTTILPGKGFISNNNSPQFGTSGHEELILSHCPDGTQVDYTYEVTIHKPWLRVVATPLIRWYSMRFWEHAVIDRLKEMLERE